MSSPLVLGFDLTNETTLEAVWGADIDKQEFNLVPLDLKTFIDFYVFFIRYSILHRLYTIASTLIGWKINIWFRVRKQKIA